MPIDVKNNSNFRADEDLALRDIDLWSHLIFGSFSIDVVLRAVNDDTWQCIRRNMLGKTLSYKFRTLEGWASTSLSDVTRARREIQVTNYILALRRGGLIR